MKIPAASTEYIYTTVTGDSDLTGAVAEVTLPVRGNAPDTWRPAAVVGVADNGNDTWTVTLRVLLGPEGDITLTQGNYDWWTKIIDTPEIPVRLAGNVQVT